MTINLNKSLVSKKGLLRYITELDVYQKYTGQRVVLNHNMSSPLREDKNPSFSYYVTVLGEIYFKDFVLGGGDFIQFVQMMFGLSFFDALSKIAIDFELDDKFIVKSMPKGSHYKVEHQNKSDLIAEHSVARLNKKRREWKAYDLAFWLQFGITKDTLTKYNVEPISYIFINDRPIKADKYAYCFIEYKDDKETIKVYQPYNKEYKWRTNHNHSVWQGWRQLPNSGETLIITKSLKDVMSITETTEYPAVAMQAESTKPKSHIIDLLQKKFKTIYLLYDNDVDKEQNWGQLFANRIIENHPKLWNIIIPQSYQCKDYSDLVMTYGNEKAKEILKKIIHNKLPF